MAEKNTRTGLSLDDMTALIKAVSESGLESFDYKEGDFSITLHSNRASALYPAAPASAPVALSMPDISMAMATAAETASGAEDDDDEAFVIKSPLVGTFYAAPAQDAEPFVKIGDRVKKGQVLAIVEAMKMMNEIESDCDGTIADILVDNGAPVEFGQPLFKIN
ncbi:MAG: acetyl-CoA carboxylase biotin carboxyl carrier protein [Clostridiales bacterium]|nr:acetyl-CoA carboxylase biotin carboxyl carrier protein [Clostridiales bacterium]MBQ5423369.1 acetyl-CoA carboxylase biotin carboxyl carrier protein [Clostridiales bacterium]